MRSCKHKGTSPTNMGRTTDVSLMGLFTSIFIGTTLGAIPSLITSFCGWMAVSCLKKTEGTSHIIITLYTCKTSCKTIFKTNLFGFAVSDSRWFGNMTSQVWLLDIHILLVWLLDILRIVFYNLYVNHL